MPSLCFLIPPLRALALASKALGCSPALFCPPCRYKRQWGRGGSAHTGLLSLHLFIPPPGCVTTSVPALPTAAFSVPSLGSLFFSLSPKEMAQVTKMERTYSSPKQYRNKFTNIETEEERKLRFAVLSLKCSNP